MTVNILRSRHRNVSTKRPRKTPDLWHLEVSAWWVLFGVSTTLEPGAKLLSWRVGFGTGGIWNSFSARLEASAAMLRSFGNSEGRGDSINLWRAGRRVWQLAFCLLRWLFDAQRSQSNLQDLSNLSEIELHPQWPCGLGVFTSSHETTTEVSLQRTTEAKRHHQTLFRFSKTQAFSTVIFQSSIGLGGRLAGWISFRWGGLIRWPCSLQATLWWRHYLRQSCFFFGKIELMESVFLKCHVRK